MIRSGTFLLLIVTACASRNDTISSINYLQAPISAECARAALLEEDGFAVQTALPKQGTATRLNATFNEDLPVTGLVRQNTDGTAEVSFFVKLAPNTTPLDRREAAYAVRRADEVVYQECTEDGKTYGGAPNMVLTPEN